MSAAAEEAAGPRLILAHSMPRFEAKPTSPAWGWHWTMHVFDPESVVDDRRSIASKLYPVIGPYDSAAEDVIEYHLLHMKVAGIDGVIIDWYGRAALFEHGRAAGHRTRKHQLSTAAEPAPSVTVTKSR